MKGILPALIYRLQSSVKKNIKYCWECNAQRRLTKTTCSSSKYQHNNHIEKLKILGSPE